MRSRARSRDWNRANRTEKFFYDGIRRIQELIADPVASVNFADMSGDPVLANLAKGQNLVNACRAAKDYTTAFLASNKTLLGYHSPS